MTNTGQDDARGREGWRGEVGESQSEFLFGGNRLVISNHLPE